MDNFPLPPTNTNESSFNKPSSPQPEYFQCDYRSSYNTLPLSEEEFENFDSEFSPSPVSSIAPTTNMPIAATQPEYCQYDYLSSYNTLTPSEEELKNFDSDFSQDPDIQSELNELASLLSQFQAPNPNSCTAPTTNMPIAAAQPEYFQCDYRSSYNTLPLSEEEFENFDSEFSPSPVSSIAPTTNMPIAAPKPEGLETKDEPSIAPPTLLKKYDYTCNPFPKFTSLLSQLQAPNPDSCTSPKTNMPIAAPKPSDNQFPVNRENTMRDLITYKADPKDYIRTCLYALCEPLLMYWKSPVSEHIRISILKTPPHEQFEGNVEQYLTTLCPPPSSSDGQDNLQSTRYKEKWDEFYNGARIAINELLQSSHTTVKLLQNNSIKVLEALNHHSNNTIDPIYSKIKKLCKLPLSHTQEEALISLFLAVYQHYKTIGSTSIRDIGNAHRKDNPVDNFKVCTVIPELKDLFSLKQQYINGLKQKIENLITYIDQNTDSNNLMVISHNSMINPKYVTMIKDIIIEKIKQNPDYEDYMPLIKLGAKPHNKLTLTPGSSLRHAKAHPLVITCQLDADESNTLTKDQRDRATNLLNAACRQINEQFTATLNRTLSCTSSKQTQNKKKKELKQPEMTPLNRKRKNTSYELSPETSPSKQRSSTPSPLLPSLPQLH